MRSSSDGTCLPFIVAGYATKAIRTRSTVTIYREIFKCCSQLRVSPTAAFSRWRFKQTYSYTTTCSQSSRIFAYPGDDVVLGVSTVTHEDWSRARRAGLKRDFLYFLTLEANLMMSDASDSCLSVRINETCYFGTSDSWDNLEKRLPLISANYCRHFPLMCNKHQTVR